MLAIKEYIRKHKKWILIVFILGTIQALLYVGIIVSENLFHHETIDLPFYLINEFTGVYTALLLIPLQLYFFKRFPLSRENYRSRIWLYLLCTIIYGVTQTSIMYALRLGIYPLVGITRIGEIFNDLPYRYLMEYFKQIASFWLVYFVYWGIIQYQNNQKQRVKAAQLQGELLKSHLKSLQMQLQPHFFFNTLNTISSIMYDNPTQADQLISRMSQFLREVIHTKDKPLHSLQEEIALLQKYTDVMLARYPDKLQIEYHLVPESLSYSIPVLLLQPIVENSIKYSIDHRELTRIQITAVLEQGSMKIQIIDNGPGIEEGNFMVGTGLSSTVDRLEKLYEGRQLFMIENQEDDGTIVTINIPDQPIL